MCINSYYIFSFRHVAKKQKRLTSFEKGRILQMRNNGNTTFFIMQELGKSRSTINDFILRMSKGGNIERVESSGRKRKTTPRDDKLIVRQVLKSRRVSCPSIREDLGFQHVSIRTIQRRIKETGRFVSTWKVCFYMDQEETFCESSKP